MEQRKTHSGALAGGIALIAFGLLFLVAEIFQRANFWHFFWPFFPIALGVIFFVVMFAGGKSAAGFAVPATIITMIGLILLFQNLTGLWQTWAYAWALIVVAVGLGIWIMGVYGDMPSSRQGGLTVMKIGLILFIIFGAVMELIFAAFVRREVMQYIFPALMVLLGIYLIFRRATKQVEAPQPPQPPEPPQPTP